MAYAFNDDKSKCNLMFNKIVEYQEFIKGHTANEGALWVSRNDLSAITGTDDLKKIRILAVYIRSMYQYDIMPVYYNDIRVIRAVHFDPTQKVLPLRVQFDPDWLERYASIYDELLLIIGVMD